jgi:quinol-cytochrome oxidoreductase complex cytochrome b subunit
MTEIPEHLLKRAQAARDKAAGGDAGGGDAAGGDRIPDAMLDRTKAASATAVVAAVPAGQVPVGAGPGGHTQRLLTVVKSGSIQESKAAPVDKVHTWPHLLAVEFVAALACTAFLFLFSWFVNAPLLQAADFNATPNPSKAPWYFLGLQELLTMFHPMIAGVTLPGIGLVALMLAPYLDRNPSVKPEDRKFMTGMMTMFLMFWAVLVIIGSFFRGPGFNFIFPWRDGIFFEL